MNRRNSSSEVNGFFFLYIYLRSSFIYIIIIINVYHLRFNENLMLKLFWFPRYENVKKNYKFKYVIYEHIIPIPCI